MNIIIIMLLCTCKCKYLMIGTFLRQYADTIVYVNINGGFVVINRTVKLL